LNYTHTYKNHKQRNVKCAITDGYSNIEEMVKQKKDFHVIVTNEVGFDVYLKFSKLTKIEDE